MMRRSRHGPDPSRGTVSVRAPQAGDLAGEHVTVPATDPSMGTLGMDGPMLAGMAETGSPDRFRFAPLPRPALTAVDAAVPPGHDASPASAGEVDPHARSPEDLQVRAVSMPVSPSDHEGVHRALLWVARGVEECGRAFTRLTSRVRRLEGRLDAVEAEAAATSVRAPSGRGPSAAEPGGGWEEALARVNTRMDEAERVVGRVDGVENRLRQLDFLPLKLSNLQRTVDQLAPSRRIPTVAADPTETLGADVAQLGLELAALQARLATVEEQIGDETVPAMVEGAIRQGMDRLAEELPSAAVDVQGLYRELDSIAEFIAARAAATAESLERVGALELAVLEMRRDLSRIAADVAAVQRPAPTIWRLGDIESRVQHIESWGGRIDKLFFALQALGQDERPGDGAETAAESSEPDA